MPDAARAGWGRRLAVDFGTTHTVAVLAPATPLLFDASPLLSSAVAFETGRLLTGRDAVRTGQLDPARYEPNPKLRIDDGQVLLGETSVAVEELIAAPLRRVATEAARHLGALPSGTVLTCPAAWGTSRRGVLLRAAEAAASAAARARDSLIASRQGRLERSMPSRSRRLPVMTPATRPKP
jgi:molecular chaperone DnaK (HSP70)